MPATAGRVRMPANNRVHSSRALQTHSIWQSAIGYDPYAPESESKSQPDINAYSNFQGLLALAKVTTGSSANGIETRGACKKCGRLGHLSYQCRNFLSFKKEDENKEIDAFALDSVSKAAVKEESQSSGSDPESDSDSDSSVDPEIERIIAEKYGKKFSDGLRGRSKIGGSHNRARTRRRKYIHSDSDSDSDSDRKSKRHRRKRATDSSSDPKSNQHRRKKEIDSGSDSDSDYDRRHKRRRHRRRKHRERRSVLSSGSESTDSSSDEERRRRRRKHKH